jgi:hypothetical protein
MEGLSPKEKARPLQLGDITHQLLHAWDRGTLTVKDIENLPAKVQELYPTNPEGMSEDIAIEAANLVRGYLKEHAGKEQLKMIPGETGLLIDAGDYLLYGKVDVWARDKKKQLWRGERKTTAKIDSFYLGGLKSGLQGGIYDILSEAVMKEPLKGTFYDMLVKTKIPQYPRTFVPRSAKHIQRTWETLNGVVRDINGGDFYPSCKCFMYNRECDYRMLCENDSDMTRNAFYEVIPPDVGENEENEKEVEYGS